MGEFRAWWLETELKMRTNGTEQKYSAGYKGSHLLGEIGTLKLQNSKTVISEKHEKFNTS